MRLWPLVLIFLLPTGLLASAIDGITYNWGYADVENTSALIVVDFSVPVTAYSFDISLQPEPTENNQIWSQFGQATWNSPITAAVTGSTLPYGLTAGVSQIDITVGYDSRYPPLPVNLNFTSLTDPPAGGGSTTIAQIDNPEPATASLIALGLFALFLWRAALSRKSILA